MANRQPNLSDVDRVLEKTINHLEEGKEEVFGICENAREEHERLQSELQVLKERLREVIEKVDQLESEDAQARKELMHVSRNFSDYTEEEVHRAYERAREIQIRLSINQEKEEELKRRRDELDRSLQSVGRTMRRAESIVSHMGQALDFLKEGFQAFSDRYRNLVNRHLAGMGIIRAQESERKRIAREIHDGPAQLLANLVFRVGFCERVLDTDPEKAREEIGGIRQLLQSCLSEIRRVIFNLRPVSLDDLGLVATLREYVKSFRRDTGLDVEFAVLGNEEKLDAELEIGLFRMIQEAMNNAYKHAQPTQLTVKVDYTGEQVRAEVTDDGTGFDLEEVLENTPDDSYGIKGLYERAEILDGSINFETELGRGTRVVMYIPREER